LKVESFPKLRLVSEKAFEKSRVAFPKTEVLEKTLLKKD
jgi:hypothetical protein